MPQSIPLNSVPSQTLQITLGGQATQLNIYQKASGLYMDVLVNNAIVITGVLCQNLNRIIRSLYLGYNGDFVFIDNQDSSDPFFTGLGNRFTLVYLSARELLV